MLLTIIIVLEVKNGGKEYFFLFEVVLNNSFILYNKENRTNTMIRLKFREEIIESLINSSKIYDENHFTRTFTKVNFQKPIINIEKIHNLRKIGKNEKEEGVNFV